MRISGEPTLKNNTNEYTLAIFFSLAMNPSSSWDDFGRTENSSFHTCHMPIIIVYNKKNRPTIFSLHYLYTRTWKYIYLFCLALFADQEMMKNLIEIHGQWKIHEIDLYYTVHIYIISFLCGDHLWMRTATVH